MPKVAHLNTYPLRFFASNQYFHYFTLSQSREQFFYIAPALFDIVNPSVNHGGTIPDGVYTYHEMIKTTGKTVMAIWSELYRRDCLDIVYDTVVLFSVGHKLRAHVVDKNREIPSFTPIYCCSPPVFLLPLNTTTILGNGALFTLSPNFSRPLTNRISALL